MRKLNRLFYNKQRRYFIRAFRAVIKVSAVPDLILSNAEVRACARARVRSGDDADRLGSRP